MTPPFLRAEALAVPHGFFTRQGGVSEGGYASLNGSLSGGDARDRVLENRARAARALGAEEHRLLGVTQVHGTAVLTVTQPWAPGEGGTADAMVTAMPGLALAIVTADCAPVLFADAAAGVVGAAHAGWRGAATGILEATVTAMLALGAVRERIRAAIGPCIAAASYAVRSDMRGAVLAADPHASAFFTTIAEDQWRFDLSRYALARLQRAGIGHASTIDADTCADEARFFSHRRRTQRGEGPIGHQLSVIRL